MLERAFVKAFLESSSVAISMLAAFLDSASVIKGLKESKKVPFVALISETKQCGWIGCTASSLAWLDIVNKIRI